MGYDCLEERKDVWHVNQTHWCCKHRRIGCDSIAGKGASDVVVVVDVPQIPSKDRLEYNCAEDYHTWRKSWSPGKRSWCCIYASRGCALGGLPTTSKPYDCSAGYKNWKKGWSTG